MPGGRSRARSAISGCPNRNDCVTSPGTFDPTLFDAAQAILARNATAKGHSQSRSDALLLGKLFDDQQSSDDRRNISIRERRPRQRVDVRRRPQSAARRCKRRAIPPSRWPTPPVRKRSPNSDAVRSADRVAQRSGTRTDSNSPSFGRQNIKARRLSSRSPAERPYSLQPAFQVRQVTLASGPRLQPR
jgi:hypothetical protein